MNDIGISNSGILSGYVPNLAGTLRQGETLTGVDVAQHSTLDRIETSSLVDTPEAVAIVVEMISNLPLNPPSIYIDLEGVNLCRYGTISILQLFILPTNQTHLIDIHTLGKTAFTTTSSNGNTLKSILESPNIPKAFFDVRNDSDALFAHFGIHLSGVCDIQLMELATRRAGKRYVNGLAKCMERDLDMTLRERQISLATKAAGLALFDPNRGGSYEVFNIRPMPEAVRQYCMQDVQFLPRLWRLYSSRLSAAWARKVDAATKERVVLSQSKEYEPKGPHKAFGPW